MRIKWRNAAIPYSINKNKLTIWKRWKNCRGFGVVEEKSARLEILKKAFSTNGLLAYKIENLVKDLEQLTNEYLAGYQMVDSAWSLSLRMTN